jgi:hypothetical protein
MDHAPGPPEAAIPIERSTDRRFVRRMKRLIGVSAIALGLITWLGLAVAGAGVLPNTLLVGGWVSMPLLLAAGLTRPGWRYLLAVPAGMVLAGLIVIALGAAEDPASRTGWWLMAGGILLGATLGGWFWYRWVPVPRFLDDPFSPVRWSLVAAHTGLVVLGFALVVVSEAG